MNWSLLFPAYSVLAIAFSVMLLDIIFPKLNKSIMGYFSGSILLVTSLLVWFVFPDKSETFGSGIMIFDQFTRYFIVFFMSLAGLTIICSTKFIESLEHGAEYYGLLSLSVVGGMGMAASKELVTAYISLELLTFCLYVLVSFSWKENRANEAGIKYILLGAVASAFMLFGISYIYGVAGSTMYNEISHVVLNSLNPGLILGLALLTAGLAFKIAAVPFHMWTPDVYEGGPIPISAYLAAASKAAALAMMMRLAASVFSNVLEVWSIIMIVLAVASLVLGNLVAIRQTNIKRLMAYSSIGQVGFFLLGIAAFVSSNPSEPAAGLLIHSVSYGLATLTAFMAILIVYNETGIEEIKDYAGLSKRNPFIALVLTVSFFSLAGFPFFVGFASKFYLFTTISVAGTHFLVLVGLAILASIISMYYYLKVIKTMYVDEPNESGSIPIMINIPMRVVFISLALLIGVGGLYVLPLARAAEVAARSLFV